MIRPMFLVGLKRKVGFTAFSSLDVTDNELQYILASR